MAVTKQELLDSINIKIQNDVSERTNMNKIRRVLNEVVNLSVPINEPLLYKALISQSTPILETLNPNLMAGQVWELTVGAIDVNDKNILDHFILVSGILYEIGSKYKSTADIIVFFNTAKMAYDGAPYISSNGITPFNNTLGITTTFVYNGVGTYRMNFTGLVLDAKKAIVKINSLYCRINNISSDHILFNTYSDFFITPSNNILNITSFEIEYYN